MTLDLLRKRIIEKCVRKGSFTTRSGQTVATYFDKYQFEGDPTILDPLSKELAKLIPDNVEILAGLEMGGIPITTALSIVSGIPTCFVRKKPKTHGTMVVAEGPSPKGKNVLIIEDVTTTGGQIILSAEDLRKEGANVLGVLLVIARSDEAVQNLRENSIEPICYIKPIDLEEYM